MKTPRPVGQAFRQSQLATVKVRFDDGPGRIEGPIPNRRHERDARCYVTGDERTRFGCVRSGLRRSGGDGAGSRLRRPTAGRDRGAGS
jgi:hypothetical protein